MSKEKMKSVDMTPAIQGLLKPFWTTVGNKESLEEFVEAFFVAGGKVNLQLPDWLKDRLGIQAPTEMPEDPQDQFVWGEEEEE